MSIHLHIHTYIYMYIYIHNIYIYTCIYACIYTCIYGLLGCTQPPGINGSGAFKRWASDGRPMAAAQVARPRVGAGVGQIYWIQAKQLAPAKTHKSEAEAPSLRPVWAAPPQPCMFHDAEWMHASHASRLATYMRLRCEHGKHAATCGGERMRNMR
jgi:hypothetical protein